MNTQQENKALLLENVQLSGEIETLKTENDKLREALELAIDDLQEIKDIAATSLKPDAYTNDIQFLASKHSSIKIKAQILLLALQKAV